MNSCRYHLKYSEPNQGKGSEEVTKDKFCLFVLMMLQVVSISLQQPTQRTLLVKLRDNSTKN